MFKKAILFSCIFAIITGQGFCAQSTFQTKFSTCSSYVGDTDTKIIHIVGWVNRKCLYRELDIQDTLTCQFDRKKFKLLNQEMNLNKKYYTSLSDLPKWEEYSKDKAYCAKNSEAEEKRSTRK